MVKRILFYYTKFNIGGAERSLARMMNALCQKGHSVVLLTRYGGGTCESMLDSRVKHICLTSNNDFCEKSGVAAVFGRCFATIERVWNCIKLYIRREKFDLVVLGSQGMSPVLPLRLFRVDKVVKCIRNDLSKCYGRDAGIRVIKKYKDIVDNYLCVSGTAKESLDCIIPEVAEKSIVYYNFLNTADMKSKISAAVNPFADDHKIHIVTVCRVADKAKGVFRMLDVCERLLKAGYPVKWYVVGDGEDHEKLKSEVIRRNMDDFFILTGRKDNPFGYYAHADLVAVLSYYEGLCGVVNEAKVSGAAVIATEFSGIYEQLQHGVNGWIVENDEESIYEGMAYLLDHQDVLSTLRNTTYPPEILEDEYKLEKLYKLLGWE